jgi:anti-sigma factor RsiW
MGRLRDAKLRKHLNRCSKCAARVGEHGAWIAALKRALSTRLTPIDVLNFRQNGSR